MPKTSDTRPATTLSGGETLKRILLFLVVLALGVLTACNPQPAAPTDVSGLQQRLDDVGGRLDALRADVQQLQAAAVQLDASVRVNTNLSSLLAGLTGVVLETYPADLEVWVEPGACPDGLDDGSYSFSAGSVGTSYHSLPAGTYCLGTPETDTQHGAGVTLTVPDGVIVSTTLYAKQKEATP